MSTASQEKNITNELSEFNIVADCLVSGSLGVGCALRHGMTGKCFTTPLAAITWRIGQRLYLDAEEFSIASVAAAFEVEQTTQLEKYQGTVPPYAVRAIADITPDDFAQKVFKGRKPRHEKVIEFETKKLVTAMRWRSIGAIFANLESDLAEYPGTPEDFVQAAMTKFMEVSDVSGGKNLVPFGDVAMTYFDQMMQKYEEGNTFGIETGFRGIDNATYGMQPGDLWIIAADSGKGKSIFAKDIARNVAMRGKHVAFISLEMSEREIFQRFLWTDSGVDSSRYFKRELDRSDKATLQASARRLEQLPVSLTFNTNITMSDIRVLAREAHHRGELDVLMVDYTQLITAPEGDRRAREQQVASFSKGLKEIACDLQIPVVSLSQLNDDGKMRESRAIKYDASVLIVLKCIDEEGMTAPGLPVPYSATVEKSRSGDGAGKVDMELHKRITTFRETEGDF